MADITLLPSAKVPLIYPDTNGMTTEWYRFFWNIYGFTGTGVVPVNKGGTGLDTIGDHQLIIGNANNVFEPASLSSASIAITYPVGFVNLELGTSGVTPGTYGSASQVGVFTVNQYGVLTAASNILIGIDASQIISGTIASARISGSYTGITGVGTLTVGTWNATAIGVAYGGTGQTTYTNGQLLIGNTTGNTLTKATLTAGSGVTITNGAGSITISATGSGGTVTSVTGTAPVVSSGGTTPAISMPKATTSVDGYLSSTDWTTFNNKGSGSVTSVAATVPAFLSVSGSPVTTSGTLAITLSGTALPVANGGTGLTTLTTGYIPYGNGTSAFSSSSSLYFSGTQLGVGTSTTFALVSAELTGGNAINARYNSGNSRAGIYVGGSSGNPFFGYNLNYSSGNVFNYDKTGMAWFMGDAAGTGYFSIAVATGTSGTSASTDTTANYRLNIFTSGGVSIGNTTDPGSTNLSVTGTILSGTTSTAGSISNAKRIVGGQFSTTSGNTGSMLNATPVTIATLSLAGVYTVGARLIAGTTVPAAYFATATIAYDGSAGKITAINATNLTITLSGSDVQVTQISGGTQSAGANWSILNQYIA